MNTCTNRTSLTLKQMANRILTSGKITRIDQDILMRVMLSNTPLSDEEQLLVQCLLHRLEMGLLKVV